MRNIRFPALKFTLPVRLHRSRGPVAPPALPLARGKSAWPLMAILGLMVFLATLAMMAQGGMHILAARWDTQTNGALTVELTPLPGESAAKAQARFKEAIETIRGVPGVAVAAPLPPATAQELLQPWLGTDIAAQDLPLPMLVDVTLAPRPAADATELETIIAAAGIEGAHVDDRNAWLRDLAGLARLLQGGALAAALLAAAALLGAVALACRAGLAIHHDIVELLHIMGASDNDIAGEFGRFIKRIMAPAALAGGAAGFAALTGMALAAGRYDVPLASMFAPTFWAWARLVLSMLLVPALAYGAALLAARQSVLASLRTMP